jgi:hypothetical protein
MGMCMEKTCSKCKQTLDISNFQKKGWRYGKQYYFAKCKVCMPKGSYLRYKKWRKNNKYKVNAQAILRHAVMLKEILKPNYCELCKKVFDLFHISGHHQNYNKPLEVIWVCPGCHKKLHMSILPSP